MGGILIMLLTPYYKIESREKNQKRKILNQFRNSKAFMRYVPAKSDGFHAENRMQFGHNQPTLSIVVGESGIGKTTEICTYAKELREQGHPVIYYSFQQKNVYKFEDFLISAFGTTDLNIITDTIGENYTDKGIFPTLILDNIHYAKKDGKIDEGLLTFLNVTFYQALKMEIIMLSSVNRVAYEIENCYFFVFFLYYF